MWQVNDCPEIVTRKREIQDIPVTGGVKEGFRQNDGECAAGSKHLETPFDKQNLRFGVLCYLGLLVIVADLFPPVPQRELCGLVFQDLVFRTEGRIGENDVELLEIVVGRE